MRYFSVALISTISLSILSFTSAADKKTDPAIEQAKSKIRAAGGSVLELAQNDDRLEVAFHLSDQKITDETLKTLAGLTKVTALNLRGTDVTSAGLAQLKGLKGLTHLHLEKTKVNDEGLKHLKAGLLNTGLDAGYFEWPPKSDPDRAPIRVCGHFSRKMLEYSLVVMARSWMH